jgi:DNA-nicking Smr family endonuclease
MSLKITNKLTQKQREFLLSLDYVGTWNLTTEEAAKVIDELLVDKMENGLTYGEIQDGYGQYLNDKETI